MASELRETSDPKTRTTGPRALVIGAALIPLNIIWIARSEYIRYADNVSTSALFVNAVFLLMLLVLANIALRRLWPRAALTRGEILIVYVMVVVSTGLAGHDQMQILFSTIHYPQAHASPESGWATTILPSLPGHLMPPAGEAVRTLYLGNSTLYLPEHYLIWLKPLAWWGVFIMVLVWVMMCLASIFRKQWENEKLTYPIAEVPLLITDPQGSILRNRLFWLAFGIAAGLRAWVVIGSMVPSMAIITLNVQYYPVSQSPPWSAAGSIPVCFFPFAFGLSFLLPTQIGFSIWFFFLLSRLELVLFSILGVGQETGAPYIIQQGAGAAIGLAVAVIYYARRHLARVIAGWWRGESTYEPDEAMSYRTAVTGLLLGSTFLVFFAVHAGMRPVTAVSYLSLLMMIVLATARLRAEVGLPSIEFFMAGPDTMMRTVAGDRLLSRGDLTGMSLFFWLTRTSRQLPMSTHVDALQIGRRGGVRLPAMTLAVMLASGIAVVAAFWTFLHFGYQIGLESGKLNPTISYHFGMVPWQQLHSYVAYPAEPDASRFTGYAGGALFAMALSALRTRFMWWPFHPAGYLASCSWGLMRMWVPIALSWGAKVAILRYGGLKGYRRAIPFFVGLIAGEFSVGMIVSLLRLFGLPIPDLCGIVGL